MKVEKVLGFLPVFIVEDKEMDENSDIDFGVIVQVKNINDRISINYQKYRVAENYICCILPALLLLLPLNFLSIPLFQLFVAAYAVFITLYTLLPYSDYKKEIRAYKKLVATYVKEYKVTYDDAYEYFARKIYEDKVCRNYAKKIGIPQIIHDLKI